MTSSIMYCDLNLPYDHKDPRANEDALARISQLVRLGYNTIAVNVEVSQDQLTSKAKQNKSKKAKLDPEASAAAANLMLDFPPAPKIELTESGLGHTRARLLTRLTIAFQDNNFIPVVSQSETVRGYDLLAVRPSDAQAMQAFLKSSLTADLVASPSSIEGDAKDVKWTRKLYAECVERHMFFEVCYAPCIRDSTARRRTIALAHNYHAVGKSKNVIVSSGGRRTIELRGPHDVANLGFLFGLSEQQGKAAASGMAARAIRSAEGRKVGPFRATVEKIDSLKETDKWKQSAPDEDSDTGSEASEDEEVDDE